MYQSIKKEGKNGELIPSSINGLWLATGHHRNGVLLAAITTELITKAICSVPLDLEACELLMAFKWDRFQN